MSWLRRPAAILALVGLAAVGFGTVEHYRLKRRVVVFREQLEARGEAFSPIQLAPPAPPADSNTADGLLGAMRSLRSISSHLPSAMAKVGPGHALVCWQQDPLPDTESVNLWPLLAADIEANAEALAQLRKATAGPVIAFPLDFSQGVNFPLVGLSSMKNAVQWLNGATLNDLHRGDLASANSNLCAALNLLRHHQPEPVLISHLVRIAISAICVNVTWQALQHPGWNDADLARFQDAWTGTDVLAELGAAIRMDRIQVLEGIEQVRRDPHAADLSFTQNPSTNALDEMYEMGKRIANNPREGLDAMAHRYLGHFVWKWWWSYGDEILIMERMQILADAARQLRAGEPAVPLLARTRKLVEDKVEGADLDSMALDWSSLSRLTTDTALRIIQKVIPVAQQRALVIAAIALKRFRLVHGHFPERLDELVPRFLPTIPRDLMDGAPLRYQRRSDDSFLLYSIGLDGVDQGGNPNPEMRPDGSPASRVWYLATDMVWPEPGTAEEIADYEKKIVEELLRNAAKVPVSDWDQLSSLAKRHGLPPPGTNTPPLRPAMMLESK